MLCILLLINSIIQDIVYMDFLFRIFDTFIDIEEEEKIVKKKGGSIRLDLNLLYLHEHLR